MTRTCFTLSFLLAAGLAAFPQGLATDQIVQVGRATWPGDITVGIVCNYAKSGESVRAMLDSFSPGSSVKVMDVRHWEHMTKACRILERVKPQYVLLLPDDPLVHDGSVEATLLINYMNFFKIPTLATTPKALTQGAWAVMGPATGNLLQVNPALQGSIEIDWRHTGPEATKTTARNEGTLPALSVVPAF